MSYQYRATITIEDERYSLLVSTRNITFEIEAIGDDKYYVISDVFEMLTEVTRRKEKLKDESEKT